MSCVQETTVGDSIDYIECRFVFDNSWSGTAKTAQFTQNGTTYNTVLEKDCCRMPNEIGAGEVFVSVFGTQAGKAFRITTESVSIRVLCSGFVSSGSTPIPPTPDLYSQLLEKVDDAADRVPQLVETEVTKRKLLSREEVSDVPDAASQNPISGKALNAALSALAEVAQSGNYYDLINRPEIPAKLSQLKDDIGYLTESEAENRYVPNLVTSIKTLEVAGRGGKLYITTARGGTMIIGGDDGTITMTGLVTPQNTSDAATKGYVDDKIASAVTSALNTAV